jgi:hypothetical protein
MGRQGGFDSPAILVGMRRLGLVALALLLLTGCTQQSSGGAFSDQPTPNLTPQPPPRLDLEALRMLRARVAQSLPGQVTGGELAVTWGSGVAAPLTGPYREDAAAADSLGLLAARSLARRPSGGPGDALAGQAQALAASTTSAFRQLDGPQGGAYLLLARVAPTPRAGPTATDAPLPCPSAAGGVADRPECLRKHVADGLLAAWYAPDGKMFIHVGDTTTVYRPVEAISVGAALVVAGYAEHDEGKIQAGSNIIGVEMKHDFDPRYGLAYGLVSVTAQGAHDIADSNTRLADQAGIAQALLAAFDASREQQYFADARTVLEPLMDEAAAFRGDSGYLAGFDLRGASPAPGGAVDVEAAVLILEAARHYDHDDGGRFSHLEENAAQALLNSAGRLSPEAGLPGTIQPQGPSKASGVVSGLAVVAIDEVLSDLAPPPSPAASAGTSPKP